VLEPARYVKRQLSPLRLPKRRMHAIANLDLDAETPFEASDIFLICPQYDENAPESGYYIVKRSQLSPLLAELKKAGFSVGEIAILDDGRMVAPDLESVRQIIPPPLGTTLGHRLIAVGGALALFGLVLTIGHLHWRYSIAEAELGRLIAAAEGEVVEVRSMIAARNSKIAQISAVRNEKRGAVPIVSVVEEMSRVIPDSTWLTDIEVGGNAATFTGFSASAAALISVLEASPLFGSPTFNAPIVRVTNQEGERFTISMKIESPDG
jgi:general secretion pathway protein L